MVKKLVIVRHGESQWNKENKFTGWTDVDLSDVGYNEAKYAGHILKKEKFFFDFAYTSVLKRAIHTMWKILDELNQSWLPLEKSWRLNERHYGALQGYNKKQVIKEYGSAKVKQWRRSLLCTPPAINFNDNRFPGNDIRYAHLNINDLPFTENLASTINRVMFFYNLNILPRIKNDEKIIIVAHGNSIRAMMASLSNLNEEQIIKLNIPTGMPIVYEFDVNIKAINYYYLN